MKCYSCIYFVLLALIIASCSNESVRPDGYSVTAEGLPYKLCKIGDGQKKPEIKDVLLLSVVYKTQKDSIFFDSDHNAWMGYFRNVPAKPAAKSFSSYFTKMVEGDSLNFTMPVADFFKEFFDSETPSFVLKDSIIKAEVKLIAIMDSADADLYKQSKVIALKEESALEPEKILNYAKTNWKEFDSIPGSIFFKKTRQTQDSSIIIGKWVSMKYIGYFMDGTVFDNASSRKTFDFTYGAQQQLLPGMQTALHILRKGEIAKIILPSHLAFGEMGSGSSVPPYTPLVYEIEIVDVK